MTDAPDTWLPEVIYLTEVDFEDPEYPLVWASITADSGGDAYRLASLPRPEDAARIAALEADAAAARKRVRELEAENARLRAALTPSADTKAAYMGEFRIPFPIIDENGDERMLTPNVPWTTIKEIMLAIRIRAALEAPE